MNSSPQRKAIMKMNIVHSQILITSGTQQPVY